MMRHSKVDNPDLPFSLHSSLVFASRSSPAIVNKLVQGPGETFSKKNCSSDYHTKTLASLANQIRFSPMNLPPVSVPLFPIVPTIKTSALIFLHPLCNLQLHWPHIQYLTSTFPKTVHDTEGLQSYPIPDTKGILMHLILPHSLRCPADAYFTQVVSHYPHLH